MGTGTQTLEGTAKVTLTEVSICSDLPSSLVSGAAAVGIAQELHRDALLTLEQLTTSITVLALHASHRPGDSPRVRAVFEQLLEVIHQAETDMAVFDLP